MGPPLMLDKSSLQTLSHDEMDILRRYFSLVVPPVILVEILGDLKKESTKAKEPSVMSLTRRIDRPPTPGLRREENRRDEKGKS